MQRRSLALVAAALAACIALAAGVIGGAFANRGSGGTAASARTGPTGTTGPHGWHGPGPRIDRDVFAVAQDVRKAIAAKAPDIAKPIIDKAVSDGDISSAQGVSLSKIVSDERLSRADARTLFGDAKVAPVFFEVKAAIARQAPDIAKPIVDKAVSDKKITQAQGDRLIAASAWRAEGFGLGGGPGGPGPGPGKFGGPRRGFHRGP
jgi:hypothetical protein